MDTKDGHYDVNLINTVDDNRIKYSQRDYSKAQLARKIQKSIGRPSTKTFLSIIDVSEGQAQRHFCPSLTSIFYQTVQSHVTTSLPRSLSSGRTSGR